MARFATRLTVGAFGFLISSSAFAASVPGRVVDVDAGSSHACAITSCGDLVCWGLFPDARTQDHIVTSGYLFGPLPDWEQVSLWSDHTCAVNELGQAACWGDNTWGQLDLVEDTNVAQVAAGGSHTCVLSSDGGVTCNGRDWAGQSTPPGDTFVSIGAGPDHNCGIRAQGDILCWGSDGDGQSRGGVPTPSSSMLPYEEFVDVGVGDRHSCGLTNYGSLYCWGEPRGYALVSDNETSTWTEVAPNFWRNATTVDTMVIARDGVCGFSGDALSCFGHRNLSGHFPSEEVTLASLGEVVCQVAAATDELRCWMDFFWFPDPDEITGAACPTDSPFDPFVPAGSF